MAVWLPAQNRFYLPPQPVTRILSTDEYVQRTSTFLHAASERLLTVGHPYYAIPSADNSKVLVPKVSPNQYRVFRVRFPDPNNFAFGDKSIFNPETERLVWAVRGMEVGRGQPLGVGATGNFLYNRTADAENPFVYNNEATGNNDPRYNMAFDPKQTQLVILGCKPAIGEHWGPAKFCADENPKPADDACPPLQLITSTIEDADMNDIGLGNLDFKSLQANKSDAPFEINQSICKYPDYIQMIEEKFGDSCFFYARREALYARHLQIRGGLKGEEKTPELLYIKPTSDNQAEKTGGMVDNYSIAPSGSLVSTDMQLFNRPFWLQRAQGQNNGMCWRNQLFITIVDNSRGTNFNINTKKTGAGDEGYKNNEFNEYLRHCEEYQLSFILQLCKIKLNPENLAFIHTMDPNIIEDWHLSVNAPESSIIADHYRYITSQATKCPDDVPPPPDTDPYRNLRFWEIDLSDRMTEQLDQTPLGRKFLFQSGVSQNSSSSSLKRVQTRSKTTRPVKRKRKA